MDNNLTPSSTLTPLKWGRAANAMSPLSLDEMLKGLQLLGDDKERAESTTTTDPWAATPPSVQVIRAGVLGTTKRLTGWITGVGGVSSALAVAVAFVGDLNNALTPLIVATLIGAAGVVLAAGFIGIAMLASSDIQARGNASSARYQGRADVTSAFLAGTAGMCEHEIEVPGFVARSYIPLDDVKGVLKAHEGTARIRTTGNPGFHRIQKVSEDADCVLMPDKHRVHYKDIAEIFV